MATIPEAYRSIRAIVALHTLVRTLQPDIVQTHSVKSHLLVRLSLPRGTPWVASHHGYTRPDWRMAVYNQADRVLAARASRVVTPAHAFVAELVRRGVSSDRITVVHNAYRDLAELDARITHLRHALRASLGVSPHQRLVVCVARAVARKRTRQSARRHRLVLRARLPALPLTSIVAGDGPERRALANRAAAPASPAACAGWDSCLARTSCMRRPTRRCCRRTRRDRRTRCSRRPRTACRSLRPPSAAFRDSDAREERSAREPRDSEALAVALRGVLIDALRAAQLGGSARHIVETRHRPVARAGTGGAVRRRVGGRDPAGERACACAYDGSSCAALLAGAWACATSPAPLRRDRATPPRVGRHAWRRGGARAVRARASRPLRVRGVRYPTPSCDRTDRRAVVFRDRPVCLPPPVLPPAAEGARPCDHPRTLRRGLFLHGPAWLLPRPAGPAPHRGRAQRGTRSARAGRRDCARSDPEGVFPRAGARDAARQRSIWRAGFRKCGPPRSATPTGSPTRGATIGWR